MKNEGWSSGPGSRGGGRALPSKFQISAPCAGEDPAASILALRLLMPCTSALMIHRVPTLSILNPLAQGSFVLGFFETGSEIIATANSAAVLETSAGGIIGGGGAAVPGLIVGAGLPGLIAACGALIALGWRRRQRGLLV